MEQRQFTDFMENKGDAKEAVPLLQDFVARFPYCQTSQLMLAKYLHDQHSIHFDQQLKTAAVYAADRKVLYNLIHPPVEQTAAAHAPVFKEEPVFPFVGSGEINPFIETAEAPSAVKENIFRDIPETKNIFSDDPEVKEANEETGEQLSAADKAYREWYDQAGFTEEAEEELPAPKLVDPHEVIRRRLNEILGKENKIDKKSQADSVELENDHINSGDYTAEEIKIDQEIIPADASFDADLKSAAEEIIQKEAGRVKDEVDKTGLEHAMEEGILQSLEKLPVISSEKELKVKHGVEDTVKPEDAADKNETRSFLGWLKMKSSGPFGKVEEVRADDGIQVIVPDNFEDELDDGSTVSEEELIDQFIATEPRIVPSKSEFYSPVNQAKKSITEHDDLISETLARIYFNQGNLLKARSGYQKLILLHPEKSSYFAALIQEIDQLLNKQE